ncbi:MAG: FAD-binding dehydrogenase [Bacteroidia bacterium]|nr:FAD-binding dehydrogenase [Bacteroidia bacterium]
MKTDVLIIGGGLAGIAAAIELLEGGMQVALIDRNSEDRFGGLARWALGGLFYVDSPFQRKARIKDSHEQALADWYSYAEFGPGDELPRQWAEQYVTRCIPDVYEWLKPMGVKYVPSVQWVERGLDVPGNSVPRFHVVWGAGEGLVEALLRRLRAVQGNRLTLYFRHKATSFLLRNGAVNGARVINEQNGEAFEIQADAVIAAAGGITGDVEAVRRHWYQPWGAAPPHFLSGSHLAANGDIHETARRTGARITHLDLQWNYAAGVHHPDADHPLHGLSLIPPKTALWTNARGERIGPRPLISGFDTRYLVEAVARQPGGYSWQILNRKIALKELGVSGSKYNDALRERNAPAFIANLLFGNRSLYQMLTQRSRDVVLAGTVEELARKMNELAGTQEVDAAALRSALEAYDTALRNRDMDDEQVRRLAQLREYSGDRLRTCNFQPILDPAAGPLMAIREFILTRKTLGGIQTDLRSRVLNEAGQPIQGLYAIGESAGFGGGGIHGRRALEGTFLGNCIFNARVAARSLRSPR